ncbi:MAG: septal ring lytic transglycosylase RlpA family protein [Candidatus Bipolaricaulia bacterium]
MIWHSAHSIHLMLLGLCLGVLTGCTTATDELRYRPVEPGFERSFYQVGVASWYGEAFHGRPTASGEPFNMFAMTAAHKALPLGTIIAVTDLKTGMRVQVRVNDRGPFHRDRILDLSYAAAKTLGLLESGVSTVGIRVVDMPRLPHYYTLRIGIYEHLYRAKQQVDVLRQAGYHAEIFAAGLGAEERYAVTLGYYLSRAAAERMRRFLAEGGIVGAEIVSR